jgi:hypothetical protein
MRFSSEIEQNQARDEKLESWDEQNCAIAGRWDEGRVADSGVTCQGSRT